MSEPELYGDPGVPTARRLTGKVAIVTGAAGGIGAVTAESLAREGARVVVSDIDPAGAERQAAHIRALGAEALGCAADIADEAAVQRLVESTVDRFGRLDVLHNNAAATHLGGTVDVAVADADLAVWMQTLQVNVCGAMLVTKHALPHMIAQGAGSIINTSSAAALGGDLGHPAYSASKAAIISLTQSVATQYGKSGVRCNAVLPGLILTPAAEAAFAGARGDMMLRHHLTPRLGRPQDIADAVIYLASDESSFVTGHVLRVDGGSSAHLPYVADLRDSGQHQLSSHAGGPIEGRAQ
jgi:NAD(P)-dependent dehydrogenase (short-subunit alcohol dehydrogenase family)